MLPRKDAHGPQEQGHYRKEASSPNNKFPLVQLIPVDFFGHIRQSNSLKKLLLLSLSFWCGIRMIKEAPEVSDTSQFDLKC